MSFENIYYIVKVILKGLTFAAFAKFLFSLIYELFFQYFYLRLGDHVFVRSYTCVCVCVQNLKNLWTDFDKIFCNAKAKESMDKGGII